MSNNVDDSLSFTNYQHFKRLIRRPLRSESKVYTDESINIGNSKKYSTTHSRILSIQSQSILDSKYKYKQFYKSNKQVISIKSTIQNKTSPIFIKSKQQKNTIDFRNKIFSQTKQKLIYLDSNIFQKRTKTTTINKLFSQSMIDIDHNFIGKTFNKQIQAFKNHKQLKLNKISQNRDIKDINKKQQNKNVQSDLICIQPQLYNNQKQQNNNQKQQNNNPMSLINNQISLNSIKTPSNSIKTSLNPQKTTLSHSSLIKMLLKQRKSPKMLQKKSLSIDISKLDQQQKKQKLMKQVQQQIRNQMKKHKKAKINKFKLKSIQKQIGKRKLLNIVENLSLNKSLGIQYFKKNDQNYDKQIFAQLQNKTDNINSYSFSKVQDILPWENYDHQFIEL